MARVIGTKAINVHIFIVFPASSPPLHEEVEFSLTGSVPPLGYWNSGICREDEVPNSTLHGLHAARITIRV